MVGQLLSLDQLYNPPQENRDPGQLRYCTVVVFLIVPKQKYFGTPAICDFLGGKVGIGGPDPYLHLKGAQLLQKLAAIFTWLHW